MVLYFGQRLQAIETIHVHVRRERRTCKFWLEPIQLAGNHGFTARELGIIRRLIGIHRNTITEAWHEHCGEQ